MEPVAIERPLGVPHIRHVGPGNKSPRLDDGHESRKNLINWSHSDPTTRPGHSLTYYITTLFLISLEMIAKRCLYNF